MQAEIWPDGQRDRHYTRAISTGDFSSLEQALGSAEQRRSILQAELARLDGDQPAVLQLTPAALERHLQGLTEKLRSGVNGKVREVIQQAIARILVAVDGSLTIEAMSGGLLGLDSDFGPSEGAMGRVLLETHTLTVGRRTWKLATGSQELSTLIVAALTTRDAFVSVLSKVQPHPVFASIRLETRHVLLNQSA